MAPLVPLLLIGGAAYLLLSSKHATPGTSPSQVPGVAPSPAPSPSPSGNGGGGGYSVPTDPGTAPGSYDPTGGGIIMGPGGSGTPLGGAAGDGGDDGSGGALGSVPDPSLGGTVSGPWLVWSQHVNGYVPYYAGWEHGHAPPRGLPVF